MGEPTPAQQVVVRQWLIEPLPPAVAAAVDRLQRVRGTRHIALMPDVHLAADVCVGTVLATEGWLYPSAVGGDIGCGMLSIALDCGADVLSSASAAGRLFVRLGQAVPTNRHRQPQPLPASLVDTPLSQPSLDSIRRRDALVQLGTLGRGNHFLEFQADEEERLWLTIHSGSRAVGQAVRDWHVARSIEQHGSQPLPAIEANTEAGRMYLADVAWARTYADANRRAMAEATVAVMQDLFGASAIESSLITCDHNHVQLEQHGGDFLWVHRKGAMPAAAGVAGILPGSMGTATYHVEGRGNADSLNSSAHGAGRALSRSQAKSQVNQRTLRRQLEGVWFDPRAAECLREEAPSAYKNIAAVLRAQRDLTKVVRRLRPVLVYKGR